MSGPPPDKLEVLDLSTYTGATDRCNALNVAIATYNTTYGVFPNVILMDSLANAAYIGYYAS